MVHWGVRWEEARSAPHPVGPEALVLHPFPARQRVARSVSLTVDLPGDLSEARRVGRWVRVQQQVR